MTGPRDQAAKPVENDIWKFPAYSPFTQPYSHTYNGLLLARRRPDVGRITPWTFRNELSLTDGPCRCSCAREPAPSSYIQYVAIAARCVRNSLKEEFKIVAMRRQDSIAKAAVWSEGRMGENVSTARRAFWTGLTPKALAAQKFLNPESESA